jgi:hypothetical protein
MDATPSPLDRLLRLEHSVEQLLSRQAQPPLPRDREGQPLPSRHLWPVDELLLTRLLRRSPQAIAAYQAPAELSRTEQSGWLLNTAAATSVFQFCELISGEAVVWVSTDPPAWLRGSEPFQHLFRTPRGTDSSEDLVLQSLPLFKPVVRGKRWSLFRTGEMVPRHRPFPEQEQQQMLLRRIETLERQLSQQRIQHDSLLGELRSQLRVQQDLLERLLRLSA